MKKATKSEPRFPKLVAVKLDSKTADALRSAARADDRTVSSFVRRMINEVVGGDRREAAGR